MGLEQIFDRASSVMTVVSFITFMGILLWTFALKKRQDFDNVAAIPFADEYLDGAGENHHG
ncbi:MAG: cbb3-type cytochrome oxidase subunit 3 [Gammaproteobacteria bacterium]